MTVITSGSAAPPVPGVDLAQDARALLFYKVTCPVCQLAAPIAERLAAAYPEAVAGIGQDPPAALDEFAGEFGWSFDSTPDLPPYDVSNAYGIRVVPTVVIVRDGTVDTVVESWDSEGWEGLSSRLSELTGLPTATVVQDADGLPSFRPG
jgi:thiol-disulfide isomerase/thioredoxin